MSVCRLQDQETPIISNVPNNFRTFQKYSPLESVNRNLVSYFHSDQFGTLRFSELSLPFFAGYVSAGFPSLVDESVEDELNLITHLIKYPKTTYYVKATGYSMIEAGIFNKDILVVDSALEAKHGSIIIALLNGEFMIRRLHKDDEQLTLVPANPDYSGITITKEMSFLIQGVVTSVIHQFKPLH